MAKIGGRIRALREARGWTIAELADRFGGRNPRTAVSLWENDKRIPTTISVLRLAQVLEVEPEQIDPDREAYDPRIRRVRKALQKSHAPADTGKVVTPNDPPKAGVRMDPGTLFAVPDADLFQRVLGVWLSLDTHDDRAALLDHVRTFSPRARGARAKNVRR